MGNLIGASIGLALLATVIAQVIRVRLTAASGQTDAGRVAVLHCQVDQHEALLRTRGHVLAGSLVDRVGATLAAAVPPGSTLTPLPGAAFVVCCKGLTADHDALAIAESLHAALAAPFSDPFGDIALTASIGVAVSSSSTDAASDLLGEAEAAMRWGRERCPGLTTVQRVTLAAPAAGLDAFADEPLVPVSVQFPVMHLTADELRKVRPGRTLVLSHAADEPFDVVIGGTRLFEGQLDRTDSQLACVVRPAIDLDGAA